MLCDLEAGVGAVVRAGQAELVLVVTEPSAKSIEVARRATEIAAGQEARVVVVANRVRDDADVEAIRSAVPAPELVVVPDDPAIAQADRDGVAPIDAAPDAPGVRRLLELADTLAREVRPAPAG